VIADIRDFGALEGGVALATDAVNAAIAAVHATGGGEVRIPAGRFAAFSIRLASAVTLRLEAGAVLEAADPASHPGHYDPPEPNPHDLWQDFGHSHWHNSLIWGEDLEDVAILGPGCIDGRGLTREGPGARWSRQAGAFPQSMQHISAEAFKALNPGREMMVGQGNKAIALKRVKGARIDGLTIFRGGHFAVLATGCERLTLSNLLIDTNRDGLDIDACRDVMIRGCRVNTPNDDAIVLKSSLALGEPIITQQVLIEDCEVSGFDLGTMLNGTYGRTQTMAPDRDGVTGRIKLGTESSGGFRDITIRDCRFVRSRGLALETVDGGVIENVLVERLTLTEVTTAPIFLRVGDRRRGPEGTGLGGMRQIVLRDIVGEDIMADYAATLAGLPESPICDVTMRNIRLTFRGGGHADWARAEPDEHRETYPEPSMFGPTPAFGLWARHVRNLVLDQVRLDSLVPDGRPPLRLDNVTEAAP
jgi:polygalacturonase